VPDIRSTVKLKPILWNQYRWAIGDPFEQPPEMSDRTVIDLYARGYLEDFDKMLLSEQAHRDIYEDWVVYRARTRCSGC
jgi:hypothetical protein